MNATEKSLVITTVIIPLVATIADVGEDLGVKWEIVMVCYNTKLIITLKVYHSIQNNDTHTHTHTHAHTHTHTHTHAHTHTHTHTCRASVRSRL